VGSGEKPTSQGTKVADENGRFEPLKKYDRKTLVITLPGNLTVQEIGHFGIWCEAFAVDFAHVKVPSTASVPPSLRMLGVSPQVLLYVNTLCRRLDVGRVSFGCHLFFANKEIVVCSSFLRLCFLPHTPDMRL
jgi:hypothetical protein